MHATTGNPSGSGTTREKSGNAKQGKPQMISHDQAAFDPFARFGLPTACLNPA
jgi:hypothetical protein